MDADHQKASVHSVYITHVKITDYIFSITKSKKHYYIIVIIRLVTLTKVLFFIFL